MTLRLARSITALAVMLTSLVAFTAVTAGPASAKDLNCSDFPSQAAAQANLNANPSDPNGLDSEGDGIACESNPCPCSTSTGGGGGGGGSTTPNPTPKPQPKAVLRVVRILKGDVVTVRLGNAKPYNVHLLGAVVPKSSCEAKASKSYLKSYVKPGDVVRALVSKKAPNRDNKGVLRFLIREKGKFNIGLTQVADGYAKADKTHNYDLKAKYIRVAKKAKANLEGFYATC